MLRKPLFLAAITTAVLCAPALADTPKAPPAPAPPAPAVSAESSQTLRLTLVVKAGNDTRTHELAISDRGCGNITEKTTAYQDEISVCSRPAGTNLQIETSWQTRAGIAEYRTHWEAVLPRTGGSVEVGRAGANRLGLTVR
jgi:hypothetical protein